MGAVITPLAGVMLVQALVAMTITTVPVMAPNVADATGLSARWIGFYSGLAFIGAMCSIILGGALTRRFGAIRMSQASLVVAALAMVLTSFGSVPLIVVCAGLAGFGYGLATPAASHILARLTPGHMRGVVFSMKQSAVPLGGLITGLTVPAIAVAFGWQIAVQCVAVMVVLAVVAIAPLRRRFDDDRDPAFPVTPSTPFQAMGFVLRHPHLRVLSATAFAFAATQVSMVAFLVTILVERAAIDLVTAGLIFAVMQTTGVIARIALGWLSDNVLGAPTLMVILGLGIALSLVLVAAIGPGWGLFAISLVAIVIGISVTGWAGIYLAEIVRVVRPDQVSVATAGTVFFSFVGAMSGPVGFSFIAAWGGGYTPALLAYAAGAAVISLVLFFLIRRAG